MANPTIVATGDRYVKRLFGGFSDVQGRAGEGAQDLGEALALGANSRRFRGPTRFGSFSIHWVNTVASGATSTAVVSYSDLPDPDPTNDAHWGATDAGITAIDLVATGGNQATTFSVKTGCFAQWVRIKATTVTTAGSAYCWVRSDGVEV